MYNVPPSRSQGLCGAERTDCHWGLHQQGCSVLDRGHCQYGGGGLVENVYIYIHIYTHIYIYV